MKKIKKTVFLLVILFSLNAYASVKTDLIEYKHEKTTLEGFMAWDDSVKGKRPGVLIVHEWTGLGDYVKERAKMIAKMGYVAFAADIYGKGTRPDNPKDAGKESSKYKNNRKLMRERVNRGLDILRENKLSDNSKLAAIGYCFGGTTILELARSGADIQGVVSFHGGLDSPNPKDAKNIKAKLLILHGADDPYVPAKDIDEFKKEVNEANVDWQIIYYSNAVHSFTNPKAGNNNSKGAAYNEKADKRSWQHMKLFFDEIFR